MKYRKKWLSKAKVKARSGAELRSATFAIFEGSTYWSRYSKGLKFTRVLIFGTRKLTKYKFSREDLERRIHKQGASRVFPLESKTSRVWNSLASNLYNRSSVSQINRMSPTGRCLGNQRRFRYALHSRFVFLEKIEVRASSSLIKI